MKYIDQNCIEAFPEMLELYGEKTLTDSSNIGSYIFFEDYFNEFIERHKDNEQIVERAANFIEVIATTDDQDILNLVEIGILEGLVSREVHEIAKYLKARSKKLLNQTTSRTRINRHIWCLDHRLR